jgi:hypothetical protein
MVVLGVHIGGGRSEPCNEQGHENKFPHRSSFGKVCQTHARLLRHIQGCFFKPGFIEDNCLAFGCISREDRHSLSNFFNTFSFSVFNFVDGDIVLTFCGCGRFKDKGAIHCFALALQQFSTCNGFIYLRARHLQRKG